MTRPGFRLAVIATLLALLVVLLGAYTRLTHAGLGCPDWPGCYGFIAVPSSAEQLAHAQQHFPNAPVEAHKGHNEMLHRYFAGGLAMMVLGLAVQAIARHAEPNRPLRLPLLILAVLLAQAAFGMWTVTLKLWPQVVAAHLLGGMVTVSLLFLLALRLRSDMHPQQGVSNRLRRLARAGLVLVVLQIALGGWVSANYAAVACLDLPTCHGQWWPQADFANGFHFTQHIGPNYLGGQLDSTARTAIHLTHRVGAVVLSATLLALAWLLYREGWRWLAALLLAMLTLQLSLGISNVVLHMPLWVAMGHTAGGAGLMLALTLINYRLRAVPRRVAQPAPGWRQSSSPLRLVHK